jgi:hypothetical protein
MQVGKLKLALLRHVRIRKRKYNFLAVVALGWTCTMVFKERNGGNSLAPGTIPPVRLRIPTQK